MWASPAEIPAELKSSISALVGCRVIGERRLLPSGCVMFLVIWVAVFPSHPRESKGRFKLLTAIFFPMSSCYAVPRWQGTCCVS